MRDGQAPLERPRGRTLRGGDAPAELVVAGWNASTRLTPIQTALLALFLVGVVGAAVLAPRMAWAALQALAWSILILAVVMRLGALALAQPPVAPKRLGQGELPAYTIIAPLYREARVCSQLVAALDALHYPRDRLQVLLVLEPDDDQTLAALRDMDLPAGFEIFVAPPGAPKTKPRACNEALRDARGEHLVIYDAEDRPHPDQLLEAAARFRAEPGLACLQAPLRIDGVHDFLTAQFALEYAAQFETLLPALHRIGAPFPLGGSSNHFRTDVLRELGGWDAHNVTEDADLGFRLAAGGVKTGLLTAPTWEQAPQTLGQWLPQRTRWVKGHIQTWLVHMRRPAAGGPRRLVALQCTLGLGVLSALAHGPLALALAASVLLQSFGLAPTGGPEDFLLLCGGWVSALASMRAGARRARVEMSWRDALAAPLYWPLHSLAAYRAVGQLFTRPFHWDKTEHQPIAGLHAPGLD